MQTRKIKVLCSGQHTTELLQAIKFDDGTKPGSFQIVDTTNGEPKLLGFVAPTTDGVAGLETFDLGNVRWARCEETPAHSEVLDLYCCEDFAHSEVRTLIG